MSIIYSYYRRNCCISRCTTSSCIAIIMQLFSRLLATLPWSGWSRCSTTLSAHTGYIVPQEYEIYCRAGDKTNTQ